MPISLTSFVVRAVHTLSSPPFARRGAATDLGKAGGGGEGGRRGGTACSPRLQLAAVSVLRVLVTGEGAGYIRKATAAAVTAAATAGVASVGAVSEGPTGRLGGQRGRKEGAKEAEGSGDEGDAGESSLAYDSVV